MMPGALDIPDFLATYRWICPLQLGIVNLEFTAFFSGIVNHKVPQKNAHQFGGTLFVRTVSSLICSTSRTAPVLFNNFRIMKVSSCKPSAWTSILKPLTLGT
jgi:hypothetical protein